MERERTGSDSHVSTKQDRYLDGPPITHSHSHILTLDLLKMFDAEVMFYG